MSNNDIVIICLRDPDASNQYAVFGTPEPTIIDVDFGYLDLTDEVEFGDWAESHLSTADGLPEGHPARSYLTAIVDDVRDRYHSDRWPSLEAFRADDGD